MCWSLLLIMLQGFYPTSFFKKDSNTGVSLWTTTSISRFSNSVLNVRSFLTLCPERQVTCEKIKITRNCKRPARTKTRKPRKSPKSRKFFSKNFKSELSILRTKSKKLGNKKTQNSFSKISEISDFSEFSISHFFIFQKNFFWFSKVQKEPFVLKTFAMFIGRHLCWSLFLRDWQLIKKKTPKQVLSCKYWEIFENSFFI